ncbi:hypothetical protein BSZ39_03700 [Bowdeniella nasicola]|uniref:Acyl-CoA thioester hydrolase n=1 Tax=Bowdeniella nasicola TaxID=208480 RepID=A0A1Q5Q3V9_9ACTO|nr:thioesterase family protein [Bowdeniella nasicola]OKL54487.1 hypothetical protein BSZ39_03700 [Bowdeniella nasicola]
MAAIDVPIKVRWADLDAYGHVNNAAMLTLLEEVRIAVFWHGAGLDNTDGGFGVDGESATFIARQEIEYLKPVLYPQEPIPVRTWVSRMGGASVDIDYVIDAADGTPAVQARTVVVLMDTASMKPRRLTEAEREQLGRISDEPLTFRRS